VPTGYTYPVCEGKITTLRDYALNCARAFGALISMRDESSDAPIPDRIEADPYYSDRLRETKDELARLKREGHGMACARAEKEYNKRKAEHEKAYLDWQVETLRLDEMAKKVQGWKPPTPDHQSLKTFMLDQLRISRSSSYQPDPVPKLSGQEWADKEQKRLERDVEYYTKERDKERDRALGRNQWLADLRNSL